MQHLRSTPQYLHLDKIPLFAGLTAHQRRRLARRTSLVQIPAGRTLITQGQPGSEFIIVAAGSAVLSRRLPDGTTLTRELGPADFAGELALLDHTPRNASLVATTDMAIYVCSPSEFRDIMHIFPVVAKRIVEAAAQRRDAAVAA